MSAHSGCPAAMLACSYWGNSVSMACSRVPPSMALVQGINCRGSIGHSSALSQAFGRHCSSSNTKIDKFQVLFTLCPGKGLVHALCIVSHQIDRHSLCCSCPFVPGREAVPASLMSCYTCLPASLPDSILPRPACQHWQLCAAGQCWDCHAAVPTCAAVSPCNVIAITAQHGKPMLLLSWARISLHAASGGQSQHLPPPTLTMSASISFIIDLNESTSCCMKPTSSTACKENTNSRCPTTHDEVRLHHSFYPT